MPALLSSLITPLSAAPASTCAPERTGGLPLALADLPDPRCRRGIRHTAVVVIAAAVCAVVAGSRSYTAIAEWVADLPSDAAVMLGIDAGRRPSEAMIRRLLQALDPDRLATVIAGWLATQLPAPSSAVKAAIAVDGKTIRGSRTTDTAARHGLAACDQAIGVVLDGIDVDGKANEITRFVPLLDQARRRTANGEEGRPSHS